MTPRAITRTARVTPSGASAPTTRSYRGSDGRYYCKRNDGTTGLIVGAAGGAILGNVIDGGRNRTAGTLIGGALGAILGQQVDKNSSDVRMQIDLSDQARASSADSVSSIQPPPSTRSPS